MTLFSLILKNRVPILKRTTIAIMVCLASAKAWSADINCSMAYGGKNRTYLLHLPSSYNDSKPTPLVCVFHGLNNTGLKMASITGLSPIADEEDFIVVYPDGLNKKWSSPGGNVDDVGFISALIDLLEEEYNIDQNRVYATGASNGGMFTYRLAFELSSRFAAVAVIAGYLPSYSNLPQPVPSHPMPLLHFHGTADPVIPFDEAEDAVNYWVQFNACTASPSVYPLPNSDSGDGTTVDEYTYPGGNNNAEVDFYKIYNGGHTWPGASGSGMPGIVCKDISASQIAWEFFKKHSLAASNAPVVTLTKPLQGAVFTAPATVNISASATDDGFIKQVEFFNGSYSLKKDEKEAYSFTLRNVPPGTYTLKAVATDNDNLTGSESVVITVNPAKNGQGDDTSGMVQPFFNLANQQLIIQKSKDDLSYNLLINDARGRILEVINNIHDAKKIISTDLFTEGSYFYTINFETGNRLSGGFSVVH